jgi:hypothetical protein
VAQNTGIIVIASDEHDLGVQFASFNGLADCHKIAAFTGTQDANLDHGR